MSSKPNEKDEIKKSQTLVKRLVKDVKDIIKKPLTDNGIIYSHSEDNLLKGYAVVFGPQDTIYGNGAYLYEIKFPKTYPFSPPIITNLTRTKIHSYLLLYKIVACQTKKKEFER